MKLLQIIAEHYKKRPSEIIGIDSSYIAYQFDAGVLLMSSQKEDSDYADISELMGKHG